MWLAAILLLAETDGVWTEAPPDACVVLIPKNDGGMHHFGPEASLCAASGSSTMGVSVGLGHLQDWFQSWLSDSVSVLEAVAVL